MTARGRPATLARTPAAAGGRARAPALRAALVLLCLGVLAGGHAASAADARAGRAKAQACSVCHGPNGISVVPDAPNLAGQPEIYVTNQLRAYRGGERRHEVMTVIAKPLTDAEIADLAAWFSSLRVEVKLPE